MKYMFGGSGAGTTIGWGAGKLLSFTTTGPGGAAGKIKGFGGHGWGMDITMDAGGPAGKKIGGGLGNLFGRFMYKGPGDGPGTMTWGAGGGNGGSSANTVAGGQPGGGSSPELDRILSRGVVTDGGKAEMAEGEAAETAASSRATGTGVRALSVASDDDMADSRASRVLVGNVLNSCGLADSVSTTDVSTDAGKVFSVDGEHNTDSNEETGAGGGTGGGGRGGDKPHWSSGNESEPTSCEHGTRACPSEP